MIIKEHLRDLIIIPTLERIGMNSEAAVNLLMGTCYQESLGGKYLSQYPTGPARGIYQCEEGTHLDIWREYLRYRNELRRSVCCIASARFNWDEMMDPTPGPGVARSTADKEKDFHDELVFNNRYSTAMARIKYYRAKEVLPAADDIEGLARYWKKYYNTEQGKGTTEEFIKNYNKYVL